MESISFHVPGLPMPKGSVTRMPNGSYLQAGSVVSRIRQSTWRDDCQTAALRAMDDRPIFKGAVKISVECTLPYPQTVIRKYQFGWWPHIKKPDIDKLLRGVMDHLTGIVWRDDAQVIAAVVTKSYAWQGKYGAHITVDAYDEDSLRELERNRSLVHSLLQSLEDT